MTAPSVHVPWGFIPSEVCSPGSLSWSMHSESSEFVTGGSVRSLVFRLGARITHIELAAFAAQTGEGARHGHLWDVVVAGGDSPRIGAFVSGEPCRPVSVAEPAALVESWGRSRTVASIIYTVGTAQYRGRSLDHREP